MLWTLKSIVGSFSDVKSDATIVDGDVFISTPDGSIILDTVHHISHLTASDFLFA
jgi:hypothetical protein